MTFIQKFFTTFNVKELIHFIPFGHKLLLCWLLKVNQLLKDVDLADQKDTLSKDLSGGQKRKLCVGMALVGDPKVHCDV